MSAKRKSPEILKHLNRDNLDTYILNLKQKNAPKGKQKVAKVNKQFDGEINQCSKRKSLKKHEQMMARLCLLLLLLELL